MGPLSKWPNLAHFQTFIYQHSFLIIGYQREISKREREGLQGSCLFEMQISKNRKKNNLKNQLHTLYTPKHALLSSSDVTSACKPMSGRGAGGHLRWTPKNPRITICSAEGHLWRGCDTIMIARLVWWMKTMNASLDQLFGHSDKSAKNNVEQNSIPLRLEPVTYPYDHPSLRWSQMAGPVVLHHLSVTSGFPHSLSLSSTALHHL